jgi:flagellar motor switch protein FliM
MSENPLLANRSRRNETIIPLVEQFFKQLSEQFRAKVVSWSSQDIPTRIAAVEATNMSDLLSNQEFRDSVIYAVVRIRGVPVEGCVMMQYPLFAKLLEVSIGGEGGTDFSAPVRNLTDFEESFAHRTFSHLKAQMEKSWNFGRKALEIQVARPTLNPPAFGLKAKTMEVIAATVDIGPITSPYGLMSLALPSQVFERALGSSLAPLTDDTEPSFDSVLDVSVDFVAELDRLKMSVHELRALAVGSVLTIKRVDEVNVRVNGKSAFVGSFGSNGDVRAVQITDVLSKK